jgi:FtsP/CotA-like multicopper oxidase with cupredoxin domain
MAVTDRTCHGDHPVPLSAKQLACDVNKDSEDNPTIIGPPDPGHSFVRKVVNSIDVEMPDGRDVRCWGFEDERQNRTFPSPPIRVKQGKLVNVLLESSMNTHTIHFHGIEPEDCNDGVGHTSWEVSNDYVYQWRARTAGTYFYHCHVNTTLHFHMGLWGALIVDPPDYAPTNKRAYENGPLYHHERIWPWHSIDLRFRELNHAAGLCDTNDWGLNVYTPSYFLINGVAHPRSRTNATTAITMRSTETLLARMICADYFPLNIHFGGLTGKVIAGDGRPLAATDHFTATSLDLTSAERWDVLFERPPVGVYTIQGTTYDWIDKTKVAGVAETVVTVVP